MLDIGAGDGALTRHLVRAQARVIAVELHPGRAGTLRQRFPGVTVVRADAATLRLPRQPFRVVANPPFGITAELLRLLLAPGSRLFAADLVLQRAVVRQYTGGLVRGAGRWLRTFEATNGMTLPRRAFAPPPRVDSSVLVLRRRGGPRNPMR